jgi:hypothetical protein
VTSPASGERLAEPHRSGAPGDYDASFTASNTSGCGGTESDPFPLTDALRVTMPGSNPDLPPRCAINVMLVLDKSGSIQSSGQIENVRKAARAFLEAVSDTGAAIPIVDFSSTAEQQVPYTTVTPNAIANTFEPYLTNVYKPSGYTNWQAAFDEVEQVNASQTKADMVVSTTDGDPTARTDPSGRRPTTTARPRSSGSPRVRTPSAR